MTIEVGSRWMPGETLAGELEPVKLEMGTKTRVALGNVLAAGGLARRYAKGKPISGLDSGFRRRSKYSMPAPSLDQPGHQIVNQRRSACCVWQRWATP